MALACLLAIQAHAQEKRKDVFEPGNKAQSLYVEAGGPGFISINYDTRFAKSRNAWGGRIGVGYIAIDGENILTVPLQVSYLLGQGGHYFEMGAGATYVRRSYDDHTYYPWSDDGYYMDPYTHSIPAENEVMGSLAFGYRRQPVNGGFMFRAGLSPIFYDGDFIPYLPYISFGYSF